jgi:WD40 repeat protein
VSFNPSGKSVAIGGNDGMVSVLDVASQKIVAEFSRQDNANLESNDSVAAKTSGRVQCVSWSIDGRFLAVGDSDGCCRIVESWSFAMVHEIRRPSHVNCLAWAKLGTQATQYLALGGDDCEVQISRTMVIDNDGYSSCSESDDGSSAASSYYSDGSVSHHEWILKDNSFIDAEDEDLRVPPSPLNVDASLSKIISVCFSTGKRENPSEYVALASSDGVVTVFSTFDWEAVTVSIAQRD